MTDEKLAELKAKAAEHNEALVDLAVAVAHNWNDCPPAVREAWERTDKLVKEYFRIAHK